MIRSSRALLVAAGSIAMTGIALAEEPPPPPPPPPPPQVAASPLVLAKGKILIAGSTINMNLSADLFGEPTSFAPSVWYGVNEKITIGLVHDFGTTPWTPRPQFRAIPEIQAGVDVITPGGMGICVTGDGGGCPSPYDNIGFDALFAFKASKVDLAVHSGIDIVAFQDFTLRLRLGLMGHYQVMKKLSVVFDPRLTFGITERDPANGESIDLPVWAWYEITPKISAYFHTGLGGRFEDFGDNAAVPLQIGGNYKVNEKLTAGFDFGFLEVNDGLDARALGLRVLYAL